MGWIGWALQLIPGVSQLLKWAADTGLRLYSAKLAAEGAHEAKTVELASRELALEQREDEVNLQAKAQIRGRWYAPENLFGYIGVLYWGKVIALDFVLASLLRDFFGLELGWHTAPLRGDTARTMALIMGFWLGARGVQNVASIVAGAFGRKA